MKGYSLFTLLAILGGCLAVEELYINGSKRFITDGVSTGNIKDGLTTAESLINQIDTKNFGAVMKNAVSAASKFLGILNPLLGFVFSLFGSGPSAELQAIKHLFNTMQHRFDIVDQKFAQLHRAISFVPTQVSLNDIEGSITALKKEYGYLSSATSTHGYNSQKRAFIQTYDRSYHDAGTKLYHSIMSGTVANRHTGLFQEYANFTVYDRKQLQNFMLGAFNLLLQASALEITYASLRHYSNFAQRERDWVTQIRNVVNKMKGMDNDIVNNYHVYSGNDIWHDDTIYTGVHNTQDLANHLYNKLTRKWYWRDWMVMVSTNNDGKFYAVHACEVNQAAKNGYIFAIASVPKTMPKKHSFQATLILHRISPLYRHHMKYYCSAKASSLYNAQFPHETKLCGSHPWPASGIYCGSITHAYILASPGRFFRYIQKDGGDTAFLFG